MTIVLDLCYARNNAGSIFGYVVFMIETKEIADKLMGLEPGLLTMPETLALAEKALLEILCNDASADSSKIKAIELVFQKHQVGSPEEKKPMATKEDFEHLRGVISEVKTVLEGHVGFFERKYARESKIGLEGTS